ncbi:MAG: HAD family hydrolase [Lentisphaeria bacterium]|nr:HAD family hydrolase [Lentisphaeria bacterium]
MKKAFFLDRDGVINEEGDPVTGVLFEPEKVRLTPGAAEAVKKIHEAGFLAIVVSNQGGVAMNWYTMEEVYAVEKRLCELLREEGGHAPDAFYYCPHHRKGVVAEYSIYCENRKPAAGMLLKAAKQWDIDLSSSFMIGDRFTDMQAGENAKCAKCCFVLTGHGRTDEEKVLQEGRFPVKNNLLEAVTFLLEEFG